MPKLTDKTELTSLSDSDLAHVVDVSDTTSGASGTSKKITFTNIFAQLLAAARTFSSSVTATNFVSTGAANTVKEYSANSGSAITIDPANGETQYITLNAATPVITFASAPAAGTSKRIKLTLIQDGTGGRLPTFANCIFLATGSSTATAINSAISSLTYFEAEAINGAWVVASANQNLGVIDGSVAAAGYIGEVITSSVAIGSAVTGFLTATAKDVTSLPLTKGNWEVSGNIHVIAAGGAAPTKITCSISDTSNTQATSPNGGAFAQFELSFTANGTNVITLAPKKFYLSSSSTKYLVLTVTFASGSVSAAGSISAERFM